MSPNDIEVLLHCHTCPQRHDRYDAPAVIGSLKWFEGQGCIEWLPGEDFYRTTPKGRALVEMLCAVGMPKQIWVDGAGNPIGI